LQTDVFPIKKLTDTVRGSKFANNAVAALEMVHYFYASANNRREALSYPFVRPAVR